MTRAQGENKVEPRTTEDNRRHSREALEMAEELDQMGPIDYLVVEFPGGHLTGRAFPQLVDLVDRGLVRILDLAFIRKKTDGSVAGLELSDLVPDLDPDLLAVADGDADGEVDLSVFEGASSGLLGEDDLQEVANALQPGSSAGVLVYENVWAAPLAREVRRSGGQLVASGRIPVQAVLAALDASDT